MVRNILIVGVLVAVSGGLLGCESAGKNTAIGAGVGAAAGATVGAIIGHQSGNRGKGAAIGAALGASAGGVYGHKLDKQAKELEKVAETKRTENGIVTKLKGDILFASGSPAVKGSAQENINQISDIVKKYPENKITIIGHTDSTGKDSTNQSLSEQRARAVKAVMVARGVPATAIEALGAGASSPVASNSNAEGRALNRRVELNISMEEPKKK
jgi:outer membrane protein OmpA-like peptidoglycan-associated protein